jgi:hypothetical protein
MEFSGYPSSQLLESQDPCSTFMIFIPWFKMLLPAGKALATLKTTPAALQRVMVSGPTTTGPSDRAICFIDDLMAYNDTTRDIVVNIACTMVMLRPCRLKACPGKLIFFANRAKYLGHIILALMILHPSRFPLPRLQLCLVASFLLAPAAVPGGFFSAGPCSLAWWPLFCWPLRSCRWPARFAPAVAFSCGLPGPHLLPAACLVAPVGAW